MGKKTSGSPFNEYISIINEFLCQFPYDEKTGTEEKVHGQWRNSQLKSFQSAFILLSS
jgi:hypothetical protein